MDKVVKTYCSIHWTEIGLDLCSSTVGQYKIVSLFNRCNENIIYALFLFDSLVTYYLFIDIQNVEKSKKKKITFSQL